ncbi:hypothetical protein [Synoicihabitans lomoniglobus]|uniref:Uncharacterized protein n=1 Tax=Synoicihabitans lomoniglobus TaxID=2909285 RepID=A0AAF0CP61_9BACT|nr:hypothetical protein [Opitutaceae bacterium LMO-M01]WED65495.1 hypothetical protein PXH66_01360 [Opitutaceae bacterium LMO-M01]
MKTQPSILCEIVAPSSAQAAALTEIAVTCARDVGQPITLKTLQLSPSPQTGAAANLTLHLPAELAVAQHEVWCLACRLACFCPSARISVLVLGQDAFRSAPTTTAPSVQSA